MAWHHQQRRSRPVGTDLPRTKHMSLKNPASFASGSILRGVRQYATVSNEEIIKKVQYRPNSRTYGDRKAHLHAQYARMLASNDLLLLVQYDNVPVRTLDKMRREVANLASKSKIPPSSLASPSPPPSVTIIRPGVFTASLRTKFNEATVQKATKALRGSYAVISSQSLNPPQLAQLIRLVDRVAPPPKNQAAALDPGAKKPSTALAGDIPEAPPKAKSPPSIKLVAGVVEDRFFLVEDLERVSKLPTMETLQAQIVGLLSAPASKLAGLLGAASGGSLLRTLQGYEKGLEEAQTPPSPL